MTAGSGIIMDMAALVIILLSTIAGARKGFAATMVSFMQWFVCAAAGLLLCGQLRSFLAKETKLEDWIRDSIQSHLRTSIEESGPYQALPDLFSSWNSQGTETLSHITAVSITEVLMTIICFLLIVFGIKLACWILIHLFSKGSNDGVIGFIDGFAGFAFGIARGLILALLFFALLVPVLGLLLPDLAETFGRAMDGSHIASILYDDNVLLVLLRDLFT